MEHSIIVTIQSFKNKQYPNIKNTKAYCFFYRKQKSNNYIYIMEEVNVSSSKGFEQVMMQ